MDFNKNHIGGFEGTPDPAVFAEPTEASQIANLEFALKVANDARAEAERKLSDVITDRDGWRSRAEARLTLLNTARALHEAEITKIGEFLKEEADARGYCSEFDECIAELNESLTYKITTRIKSFRVVVEFRQELFVDAVDEDSAADLARELEEYGDIDAGNEYDIRVQED